MINWPHYQLWNVEKVEQQIFAVRIADVSVKTLPYELYSDEAILLEGHYTKADKLVGYSCKYLKQPTHIVCRCFYLLFKSSPKGLLKYQSGELLYADTAIRLLRMQTENKEDDYFFVLRYNPYTEEEA